MMTRNGGIGTKNSNGRNTTGNNGAGRPTIVQQEQPSEIRTTIDAVSFYISHVFHAMIYYHCVKFIISEYFRNNDDSDSDNTNNIISSLAFYGVYHRTPYNQLIHFIGVPCIIWTMILYGTYLPFTPFIPNDFPPPVVATAPQRSNVVVYSVLPNILQLPTDEPQYRMTWATAWVFLYAILYIKMDIIGAGMYIPLLYIMYATSVHWSRHDRQQQHHHWYGTGKLLQNAFLIHIFSWYTQIHWGHHMIEGATPASLVNLGAALTSAPLFAFYELIWFCGYRQLLQQEVLAQVTIYTEQLCTAGAKLRVCTITSI